MRNALISSLLFGAVLSVGCGTSQEAGGPGGGPGNGQNDGGVTFPDGGGVACFEGATCDGGGQNNGNGNADMTNTNPGQTSDMGLGNPVDPTCMLGQPDPNTEVLVPKWPTLPLTVPNSCLIGYEINNLENGTYAITSAAGSNAITLEVDVATYTAADHVRLVAADGNGHQTVLLDTCRLRTATYADPTGGTMRPPEDSIRDFRLVLPVGTKTITLDNTGATTPTYVRVLGLCDFTPLTASTAVPAGNWRQLTHR